MESRHSLGLAEWAASGALGNSLEPQCFLFKFPFAVPQCVCLRVCVQYISINFKWCFRSGIETALAQPPFAVTCIYSFAFVSLYL